MCIDIPRIAWGSGAILEWVACTDNHDAFNIEELMFSGCDLGSFIPSYRRGWRHIVFAMFGG